jgi:hypothetical protein
LKHLKHRISVHAYHRMGEAGILAPEARVELIETERPAVTPIAALPGIAIDLNGIL